MSTSCNILNEDLILTVINDVDVSDYNDAEIKEVILRIKSQTNEGKSPITDSTLELIKEVLIECAEDDEVELNTGNLNEKITKYWNESKPSRSESDYSKYISDVYENLPNINEGLFSIFKNTLDRNVFSKWASGVLVNASVVNPLSGEEVSSEFQLNQSLLDLQNKLAVSLGKFLEVNIDGIYNDKKFIKDNYVKLINAAKLYFYSYLSEGRYDFPTKKIREEFNKYLLLTNFDESVFRYAKGILSIDPSQAGSKDLFSSGIKYKLASLHVKQVYDDTFESSSSSIHTNKAVQMYISSLPEINENGMFTGNTVLFRDFNNLIRIIKDANPEYSRALREYPGEALKKTMDEIAEKPTTYFSGKDSILLNTFYTVYNSVFKDNGVSLYSKNSSNMRSSKNNLYSMIVNHINKNTSMEYTQTNWDEEEEKYKTDLLSSINLTKNKTDINRNLTLHAIKDDYSDVFNKYNVVFNTKNSKIISVSFRIGNYMHTIEYDKNSSVPNDAKTIINRFNTPEYIEFFNDVFKQKEGSDFYSGLLISNNYNSDIYKLFNLAANIFVSNKIGAGLPITEVAGKLYDDVVDVSKPKAWYNSDINALRVEGFNNALSAVEVLAKAKSYINKDSTFSNVKNSEGASLPKFGLSSLCEGDKYLFYKLFKQVTEDPKHPLRYNFFSDKKTYGMIKNVFKTEFVDEEGNSKQIKEMSDSELLYDYIVSGYFANKNKFVTIQPAVYADKSKIPVKVLDTISKFSYVNIDGERIIDNKSFSQLTPKELDSLYYETMRGQMIYLKSILTKDYSKFFSALHNLFPRKYSEPEKGWEYERFEQEVNKLNKSDIYTAIKYLQEKGENITIMPEIHYTWNKKSKRFEFNNLLAFMMDEYTKNKNLFEEKNRIEEALFAESIRKTGIRLSTVLNNGSLNKIITEHLDLKESQLEYLSDRLPKEVVDKLTKKGSSYSDVWVDDNTKELKPYLAFDKDFNLINDDSISLYDDAKDLGFTIVLNPELYKFQRLDNIISNNYNLATTGHPFLHPTKVFAKERTPRGIKAEEAARTVAFSKRGVIYGGTGHTLIKNKKDGIPQYLNIATIEDLEGPNMSLTGDNADATTQDGAIHVSPFFAKWFQNSSPELTHSSVHEKPLGFSSMNQYLSSVLFKCATFNITNSSIRSSETSKVNMGTVMKTMTDRPWIIPNLDVSKGFSGVFFRNPESNLNRHYKLIGLTKKATRVVNGKVDNIYEGSIVEVNNQGKLISDKESRIFHINSNYDLWKVFGGAYSQSLINGVLQDSEDSITQVARIANEINLTNDSSEIVEYNNLVRTGQLSNSKFAEISEISDILSVPQYSNKLIPEKYLKVESGVTYFQPMKYSDVHYLANSSGVKNGASNINPAKIYYNSTKEKVNPNSRVIFGHPALGKTMASKMGYNFISFDDYNRDKINKFISEHKLPEESKTDYKTRRDPEYQEFLLSLLEENLDLDIPVFFSDTSLLDAINNSEDITIDEIYTMSEENFIERSLKRGSKEEDIPDLKDWKANLDVALNTYIEEDPGVKVVDATGHDLYEYFNSPLLTSEFDPSYLIIQLTAEHDVEDDTVSEMTQVISALEQGSYTHDIAIQILSDIGQIISDKLDLYNRWDINTEVGRIELNTILGRALCRVYNSLDDQISLASAFLENIQKELSESNVITSRIPFDDNNILGMFETNFRNGFNRDVIKRKFSGFTGVMAPCFDMYSVYDFEGKVISAQDFSKIATKNGTSTLKDTLKSLDAEVPVSQIRCGDWVEINGQELQVGTLTTTFDNTPSITLEEIKNMRGQKIKRLSSKGRNLRAQNYSVTVNPEQINITDNNFDIYDLDSVLLSHKLEDYVKTFNLDNPGYLDNVFLEVNETIKNKYRVGDSEMDLIPLLINGNVDALKRFIKVAIQQDTNDLSRGKYHVPIKYRKDNIAYADVLSSEYSANELAVSKPFASKFLLSPGDTISDINVEFFKRKLEERRATPLPNKFYNFYFVGNNYKLHFSYDSKIVDKLRKEGYSVSAKKMDTIYTNEGFSRRVNDDISYPISKEMKFYEVVSPDGEITELVTGFSNEDVKNIWNTENFYTNNFNFSNFQAEYKDQETLDKNFGKLNNLLRLHNSLNKIKKSFTSYEDAFSFVSSLDPKLDDLKKANKMYQSFQEALKVIAARIPAQSMQSFMNMKIASFIDTDTNIVYVPIEMLIYEGSDFDIDKIYVMSSSIGDNGVYISWSPYFMWDSSELFRLSKELPLPNGKKYSIKKDAIDISDYQDLEDIYEKQQYGEFLQRLTELLNLVKDSDSVSGATDYLLDLINTHNGFQYNKSEGVKNKIFNNMYKIGSNPKNYLAATATLTIDPARRAADKSSAGRFGAVSSNDNPGAKMIAQRQNAVGKSSIGAYANGIKAFSSLLSFYQDSLTKTVPTFKEKLDALVAEFSKKFNTSDISEITEILKANALNELLNRGLSLEDATNLLIQRAEDLYYTEGLDATNVYTGFIKLAYMSDINKYRLSLNGVSSTKAFDNEGKSLPIVFTPTLPNLNLETEPSEDNLLPEVLRPDLNRYIEMERLINEIKLRGPQEEVFETLGVMLNISTDNAKELVLEKINASGELAKVYIYLISCGVPFTTITKFMTSDIISLVNKKAQRSIFDKENESSNIKNAISFYSGAVDIRNYVGNDYYLGVLNALHSQVDSSIPTKLGDFTEFIMNSSKEDLLTLMDKITEKADKFNLFKSKKMSAEESEEMATLIEEFGEDAFRGNKKDKKALAFWVNRFLKDCISRQDQLNSIKSEIRKKDPSKSNKDIEEQISNSLGLLQLLMDGGSEISEYSQWCGINQGLKTLRNDFYNFIRKRENFITRKTNKKFDLLSFIRNPEYRLHQIHLYEGYKTTFNILEAISSSPHFSKMYEALATNEDVLNKFSYKYRTFTKLADLLVNRGIVPNIDSSTLRVLKRFIDDVVVSKFFENLDFRIDTVGKELPYYNPDGSTSIREEEYLSLNDVFSRASFKRIMEKHIIPDLQKKYPKNRFLSDLMYGFTKTSFGVRDFVKLPIDLSNVSGELSENLFTEYMNGFNSIRKDTYMNTKIEDLFFLYNLMVNNNGFGSGTLTKIFEEAIKERTPDSTISKFMEFESTLPDADIDIDYKDLFIRFADKDNSGFEVEYDNGKRTILYNGSRLDLFTSDNPASLFFKEGTSEMYQVKTDNVYNKLMDLFSENKVQIKLTCDE